MVKFEFIGLLEVFDKIENFKRWLLLLFIEIVLSGIAIYLVMYGDSETQKIVFTAIYGLVNLGFGYYFGSHQLQQPAI